MRIGRSVSKLFASSTPKTAIGKAVFGTALVGGMAQGFYSGATNNGQLTNNFLETTLGTPDIDNEVFGEDMGLLTDFKYHNIDKAIWASKYTGAALGAGVGAGSAYGAGRLLGKVKNPYVRATGAALRTVGAFTGGVVGGAAGYVTGAVAPLTQHVQGPLREDFFNSRVRREMPRVQGDIVFGAYNQR